MRRFVRAAAIVLCCVPVAAARGQTDNGSPTVHALLFGDATYIATDRKIPAGFSLGQLVGHINASLDDHLTFFSELSATAQPTGYAFEVERSILRYDFNDAVKLSVGRYHTPIGYWNTAFHHGSWLQTTVSRPEMIKFGSQLIPTHFVGAFAEGNLPSGNLGLSYMIGVGNGRGNTISRGGDAGDVNGSRAVSVSLFARPISIFGLQAGAGYYHDRVTPPLIAGANEGISSAYVAWERERPEVIVDYARIDHDPLGAGPSTTNHAGYAQLGYRLTGAAHEWKPYVRAERVSTAANDVIYGPLDLGYTGFIAGTRYDFAEYAALKAEVRREKFQGFGWSRGLYVQAAFTVPDLGGGDHNSMQN
jgi:hypothetical protein